MIPRGRVRFFILVDQVLVIRAYVCCMHKTSCWKSPEGFIQNRSERQMCKEHWKNNQIFSHKSFCRIMINESPMGIMRILAVLMCRLAGRHFSFSSSSDICRILYHELRLPVNGDPKLSLRYRLCRIRLFPARIPDPGSKWAGSRIRVRMKEFKYF